VPASDAHRAIDAVWRIESPRLIAGLARIVRDVGLAEDLAQDALVAALEQWPESGVPDNPGAWLMGTAKHHAVDRLRRSKVLERKQRELARELEIQQASAEPDLDAALDDDIGDDLLSLIFTACHPVLSTEARIALTLRLVGALTTAEIARAFLIPEPTVAQRIVRAKRTLAEARVPIEVPSGADRDARLSSVLEVVYAIFNEGYAATAGDDWMRPALCEDALRLGRILARLAPEEPEVHGLVALMELQASRARARTGPAGEPILLYDQDRGRWDQMLIHRGLAALDRAEELSGVLGPYTLQAAIAACHARAGAPEETDWERIVALYDGLAALTGSPVVELNRAVAVAMAFGPEAGLELVDALTSERSLEGYHLLPSVRGHLLAKLDRLDEAREEFERAASLTRNERERTLLLERAAGCIDRNGEEPSVRPRTSAQGRGSDRSRL
jgi:RNA polymerase sigma-70 factor, ECF subfamily